jgi:spoIIIJ-associated protein
MEPIESEGKTVAEAVDSALRKLGMRRDEVEVQILQEASGGFLGLGAKPARVRLTEKLWGEPSASGSAAAPPAAPARKPIGGTRPVPQAPNEFRQEARPMKREEPRPARDTREPRETRETREPRETRRPEPARHASVAESTAPSVDTAKACAEADTVVKDLLSLMGFDAKSPAAVWDGVQERVRMSLEGADADRFVSGDGRALESFQFIVTLMVSRKVGGSVAVQVDAKGYWDKREKEILSHAEKAIAQIRQTGKPVRLPPMDAPMRRLIHRNLQGHPEVETASEGEGTWRKIVIRPRKR